MTSGAVAGGALAGPAVAPDRLAQLKQRRNGPGAQRLTMHAALLVSGCLAVSTAAGTLWLWPAMVLQGVALLSLFAALHETVHGTAFSHRLVNRIVARCAGFVLLLPADYFRAFHFAHHRFTQDRRRDPELEGAPVNTRRDYLLYMSGLNMWRSALQTLVRHARGRVTAPYISVPLRPVVVSEARMHLTLYALVCASIPVFGWWPLTLWFGPMLLAEPLRRAWLYAEHNGCAFSDDMFANTRTTKAPWWLRMLVWDMNYHTAHHVAPSVPFHALARLDQAIAARVRHRAPSYLAVHREIRPRS